MIDRFLETFAPDGPATGEPLHRSPELEAQPGFDDLARRVDTVGLGGGRFFLLGERDVAEATGLVATAYPRHAARAVPFGRDWLGRVAA